MYPPSLKGLSDSGVRTVPANGQQPVAPDPDTDPQNPDYEGPEDGPFRCDNCTYFDSGSSMCQRPEVQQNPSTPGGKVDPAGCCKFFNTLANADEESQEPQMNAHPYGK